MDDMMPIADAAMAVGVSVDTLRTWTLSGRLGGSVFTTDQGRLVPRAEIERLIGDRAATVAIGVTAWAPTLPPRRSPEYSPLRKIVPRS